MLKLAKRLNGSANCIYATFKKYPKTPNIRDIFEHFRIYISKNIAFTHSFTLLVI